MPSALASFAAGVFVATLVLTHDASRGDDLLLARGFLAPVGSNVSDVAPARAEASFADAPLLGAPREGADPSAADAPAPPALDDRSGSRGTPRALDALASTGSCVAPSDGATASAVASSVGSSSSRANSTWRRGGGAAASGLLAGMGSSRAALVTRQRGPARH